MVADVARARKRVRIFLSHIEVPQLTLGPTVRRRCEPAHIGGCKFLRSIAQIGKEACQARATKSSDNPTYLVGRERFCEGLRAGRCRRWVNHVILVVSRLLPVFPWKRTSSGLVAMSQRCQTRKWLNAIHVLRHRIFCDVDAPDFRLGSKAAIEDEGTFFTRS
jgi:hypothetical protein